MFRLPSWPALLALVTFCLPCPSVAQLPINEVIADSTSTVSEGDRVRALRPSLGPGWVPGMAVLVGDNNCLYIAVPKVGPDGVLYLLDTFSEVQIGFTNASGIQQWRPVRLGLAVRAEPRECRSTARAAGS